MTRQSSTEREDGVCIRTTDETWIWSEAASEPLRKLYDRCVTGQWVPDAAIDWSLEVPFGSQLAPDVGLQGFLASPLGRGGSQLWNDFRWEYQVWLVSQFYHGEQAALVGASRIAQAIKDLDAKKVAATQIMDEARHVDVFGRYLERHLPVPAYPVSPAFADLVIGSLSDSRWDFAVLGIQVLVEGVALAAFRMAEATLHDELIRSIVRRVLQDEVRHVSFGALSLRGFYEQLSTSERRERTDFLASAAELTARRFLLEDVWERVGIDRSEGASFASRDAAMVAYRRTVFAQVVRLIRNVGLLDARLRRDFVALGMMREDDPASASA
jgi:rubrerythrin